MSLRKATLLSTHQAITVTQVPAVWKITAQWFELTAAQVRFKAERRMVDSAIRKKCVRRMTVVDISSEAVVISALMAAIVWAVVAAQETVVSVQKR